MSQSGSASNTIGRYAVYQEIASGGMASVHFARLVGPSGFARTVAIKRPHPHLARDREFALSFIDEARLAARIRHPNVVSMLDVVQTSTDLVLVMDYIHGEALARLLWSTQERGEPVPLAIAASIMVDALHGLHAAHEAKDEQGRSLGIVHRDVSPQNILVGLDGVTRIVDFGISKAAGRLQTTTTGSSVKGKFAYMAPEQMRGEPVTRLTDTFAAAIVFWEILTGERLFCGRTDAETVHRVLAARIHPPSRLVPELPPSLDEIVTKGLSRDPSQRYQTAREMALEIEACVPAIRPSQISAWVERVAGETLAARAAALAAIEGLDASDDSLPTRSGPRAQPSVTGPSSVHSPSAPSTGPAAATGEWTIGHGEPVGITICATLGFARINDTLFLYYRVAEGPSDRDWQVWLDRLKILDFKSLLIASSTEAGPNAKQRRQLGDVWNGSTGPRPRVARLTTSAPVRSSYTALGWIMKDMPMQVFTPAQLAEALQWLGSSAGPPAASSLMFLLATAPVSGEWRRESG